MEVLVKKPGIQYLPKKIVQKRALSAESMVTLFVRGGGAYLNS